MAEGTCERCGDSFDKSRPNKRFCSERCQRIAERRRYRKRRDNHHFEHPRYQGERINDNDLGAYYAVLRAEACVYCGESSTELDHIMPRSVGGQAFWVNLAPICSECNFRKGARSMLLFMLARPLIDRIIPLRDEINRLGGLGGRLTLGYDPR